MYQLIEIVNRELTNIGEKKSAGNATATFKNYHINPYIPKFLLNYRKNYVKTFDKLCEFIINDYNPRKNGIFTDSKDRDAIVTKNSKVDAAKHAVAEAEKELKELTDKYQEYKTNTGLNLDLGLETSINEKYKSIIELRKTVETTSQSLVDVSDKFIELYNKLIQRFEGPINKKYSNDIDEIYSFMNSSPILKYIPIGDTLSYLFNGYLYRMPLIYFDYDLKTSDNLVQYKRPSQQNFWQTLDQKYWINALLLFYANRFYELNGFNYPIRIFIMSQYERSSAVDNIYKISKGVNQNIMHIQSFNPKRVPGAIPIIKIHSTETSEYAKLSKMQSTTIKKIYEDELNEIIEPVAHTLEYEEEDESFNINKLINLITAYDLIKNGQADIKKYNGLVSIIPEETTKTTGGTRRYRRTKNKRLNKPRITKRFKSNYSINERLYSKKKIKNKTKRR